MISKVLVYNRFQVTNGIQLFNEQDFGLISIISYPTDVLLTFEFRSLKGIQRAPHLTLCFNDMTLVEFNAIKSAEVKKYLYLFSTNHANSIIDFINQYNEKLKTLIVHCDAGVSRSGAVGLWANRYLELSESDFWINNPKVEPNSYVLNVLYELSGLRKRIEENLKYTFNKRVHDDRRKEDPNG